MLRRQLSAADRRRATAAQASYPQRLMARGRNAAVIVLRIASVHKWPALTEVLAKIYMILPLQEAQNDYRSSFVTHLCRYRRRDHRESLRMATGCPLRALHQAEGLEQVGSVPAIRSRSAVLIARLERI